MDSQKAKILVVDDSQTMIMLIKTALEGEGYQVTTAGNGKDAVGIIQNMTPELIISDINMPEMNGIEFREYVNSQPKLSLVPFIFLTTKDGVDDRIRGIESGADDYLTKPFKPDELTAIVRLRLSKSQRVGSLIKIDKLTGLLNRRAIDEVLADEMERMKNRNSFLSVALFDIDHFKKVNDTYGHQTGDMVLSTVASEIKKGMKDLYYAGRYGGEEFIVVMPDTLKELAVKVADKIRDSISKLTLGEMNIKPTISCGVATSPEDTPEQGELVASADRALYMAKESGRNRVVPFRKTEFTC